MEIKQKIRTGLVCAGIVVGSLGFYQGCKPEKPQIANPTIHGYQFFSDYGPITITDYDLPEGKTDGLINYSFKVDGLPGLGTVDFKEESILERAIKEHDIDIIEQKIIEHQERWERKIRKDREKSR